MENDVTRCETEVVKETFADKVDSAYSADSADPADPADPRGIPFMETNDKEVSVTSDDRGVILFNRGEKCIVRAIVCLNSLRQYWNGPVTFFLEKPFPEEFVNICQHYNVTPKLVSNPSSKPLVRSAEVCLHSPYEKTLWLDCDTLIVGAIDEMFEYLNSNDVAIPHFAYWWSDQNIVTKRISNFEGMASVDVLNRAMERHPAINTGVIAFKKDVQFIKDWVALAQKANDKDIFIPDEVAFQVLYPSYPNIYIAPPKFNVSVKLDKGQTEDVRIIHYHGSKHVKDLPLSEIWKKSFNNMRQNNTANINRFLKYADDKVLDYLEEKEGIVPVEKKKKKQKQKQQKISYDKPPIHSPEGNLLDERGKVYDERTPPNRRGEKVWKEDSNAWRWGRDQHVGVSVSNEFYQTVPHFFTREKNPIPMVGHYRGASIFVICNGPSFKDMDHSLLRQPGIMTYGMNNGPKSYRPDFWTCVDDPTRFLKSIWVDPKIQKIVPFTCFEKKIFDSQGKKWKYTDVKVGDCPNVVGFERNGKFIANRFLFEESFNWGCEKGYGGDRSVMLPVFKSCFLMGFRRIYLLGCDFNMSETNTYHFDEQREKGAVNCNTNTYKQMNEVYFEELKPYFDAEGLQVFNCNKDSGLKVFPYMPYEDAVNEAVSWVGDVDEERTWGMYSKPDAKMKYKDEPEDEAKKNLTIKDDGQGLNK